MHFTVHDKNLISLERITRRGVRGTVAFN